MATNICVTGATGLIGSALLDDLASRDFNVTAVARTLPLQSEQNFLASNGDKFSWLQGDLNSYSDCLDIVNQQEVIFHLAQKNSPLTSDLDWPSDALLNIIPTLNLIKAIKESGNVPHLIYPSSGGAVYGSVKNKMLISEANICFPQNSYGIQKLTAENYLRLAAQRGILRATVLRISNVYGWLLSPSRKQGFIGTAINQIKSCKPIRLFGNPDNVRDYVYKDDVTKALLLSITSDQDFEIFNIGTGVGTSVNQLIQIIEKILNRKVAIYRDDSIDGENLTDWCVLDASKAKKLLNWEPDVSIVSGVKKMIENCL
ncbi:NAD-dependent epimerase/dehydratase family protein [Thiorhodococcus minor]|uniref:NAD-dependent epimerase/dehydratase family protein n=1 Tax=Thiorhodococcus minor TaxID=57489 RepID=A0A6M0K6Q2_9GAMM|nr:NAD-dependent epimerase/dehydratase family protein [Thiorhodococcus minor]NEV65001.1 NAD-dependent epimerase/dehydratase family protein [Thiorhodococcus minor]